MKIIKRIYHVWETLALNSSSKITIAVSAAEVDGLPKNVAWPQKPAQFYEFRFWCGISTLIDPGLAMYT